MQSIIIKLYQIIHIFTDLPQINIHITVLLTCMYIYIYKIFFFIYISKSARLNSWFLQHFNEIVSSSNRQARKTIKLQSRVSSQTFSVFLLYRSLERSRESRRYHRIRGHIYAASSIMLCSIWFCHSRWLITFLHAENRSTLRPQPTLTRNRYTRTPLLSYSATPLLRSSKFRFGCRRIEEKDKAIYCLFYSFATELHPIKAYPKKNFSYYLKNFSREQDWYALIGEKSFSGIIYGCYSLHRCTCTYRMAESFLIGTGTIKKKKKEISRCFKRS
ncbi:hypothetical protein PUN28_010929 [Cardiocondyla obscurior]|uniref:Uncharacterized protein n=1 Tax=Cardiocondyla obscurior TaxID=286306 RepID=A0AAW2FL14_9HYME